PSPRVFRFISWTLSPTSQPSRCNYTTVADPSARDRTQFQVESGLRYTCEPENQAEIGSRIWSSMKATIVMVPGTAREVEVPTGSTLRQVLEIAGFDSNRSDVRITVDSQLVPLESLDTTVYQGGRIILSRPIVGRLPTP